MAGSGHCDLLGALLATNLKASLMLRGAFTIQVVFMALNNFTFFVFWWILMRRVPEIRGWRLPQVQVLFGMVAVAVGLRWRWREASATSVG